MEQLFAQIIGFIALFFSIAIYQFNKRNTMLYLQLVSALLFGIHFIMLGALTAALMNFINCFRCYVFANYDKKWAKNHYWLYFFLGLFWIAGILSWQKWYSILPIIGMTATTIAFWMKNTSKIRFISLISPPNWFTHNFLVNSYSGMLGEIFILSSIIIGVFRFDEKSKSSYIAGFFRNQLGINYFRTSFSSSSRIFLKSLRNFFKP